MFVITRKLEVQLQRKEGNWQRIGSPGSMLLGRTMGEKQLCRSESTFSYREKKTVMADWAKIQHYFFMMPQQVIILSPETILHCEDTKPHWAVENRALALHLPARWATIPGWECSRMGRKEHSSQPRLLLWLPKWFWPETQHSRDFYQWLLAKGECLL